MTSQENPHLPSPGDPAVQFWIRQKADAKKGGNDYWLNVATRTPQSEAPRLGRGGILADGMGLGASTLHITVETDRVGKTLTVLALAIATKNEKPTEGYSNATLIGETSSATWPVLTPVCPLSVLSNWEKQIRDHVTMGGLSFYTYHGDAKGVTATSLQNYDVSRSSYNVL